MVEGAVHGGDGRSWRLSWRFGLQLEFVRWGSAIGDCKIGLALGGGSARGWAHIGVLRALNDPAIRTAVGGMQASFARHDAAGETADALEQLARTQAPVT